MGIRTLISSATAHVSQFALNGPFRKVAAFILENIDDRHRISTTHGSFSVRVGNTLERWRADTVMTKEPETIAWLDDSIEADSVFYDIGANIGLYSLYALHRAPGQVRAVCFEPEALNSARLNQNLNDNGFSEQATVFAIGLGATEAVTELRLSRLQAGRALHGDSNVSKDNHDHRQGLIVMSLDQLVFGDGGLLLPTHLKIDVDGPELDILKGAQRTLTLPSLRHILVEVEDYEREVVNKLLANAGFEFSAEGAGIDDKHNVIYEKPA